MLTLLSDRASGPSCRSFALICLSYSRRGSRSSAAEGQWSLVWALNVCLVFLFVSVQRSLAWLSLFLALVFGVGAAAPALGRPVQLVPGCNGLLSIMFLFPCNAVSAVGDLVATPGGLPTLSGFSAVIRAGRTIVRRFSDEVSL